VYTDASKYQLGHVIMQDDKPLAFYSNKLNPAQKRYTTREQELLSVVETFTEFWTLLYGQRVIVHSDHKNIPYGNLVNNHIARWRLLLEEYSPEIWHIKGKDNVIADTLSRKDATDNSTDTPKVCTYTLSFILHNENASTVTTSFTTQKEIESELFPMLLELITKEQKDDTQIQKLQETSTRPIREWTVEGVPLLTIDNWIIIPKVLHLYLKHPGQNQMENALKSIYWWNNMREDIALYVKTCRNCQLCKKLRKKYGHLPPKDMEASVPWNLVNINLVGPLSVKTKSKHKFVLNALTMIDPATGWFEISEIKERTMEHVAKVFDNVWLS
jgi:RNase H-like domain found in reverse transcriptase/Integrase zinc binding domain